MGHRKCCVIGCKSTSETHSLYRFPKDKKLRKLWMTYLVPHNSFLLTLTEGQLLNRTVCNLHFERKMLNTIGLRVTGAYPCLFSNKEISNGVPLLTESNLADEHNYHKGSNDDKEPSLSDPCFNLHPGESVEDIDTTPSPEITTRCLEDQESSTYTVPKSDLDVDSLVQKDIMCNSCDNIILGFRYKCVTCIDYDLCPKCEMLEAHPDHCMLRIPKSWNFKSVVDLIGKWQDLFKEHFQVDCNETTESYKDDNEPTIKHVKHHDSKVDLSDDLKDTLRKGVTRVLSLKDNEETAKASKQLKQGERASGKVIKKKKLLAKRSRSEIVSPIRKQKTNLDRIIKQVVLRPPSKASTISETITDDDTLSHHRHVKLKGPVLTIRKNEVDPLQLTSKIERRSHTQTTQISNRHKFIYKFKD